METTPSGSSTQHILLTRKDVYLIIKDQLKKGLSEILHHLELTISQTTGQSIEIPQESRQSFSTLFSKMRNLLYQDCRRTESFFFEKHQNWLNEKVSFQLKQISKKAVSQSGGRPSKDFDTSSDKSKRRKTSELRSSFSPTQLAYATQMSLRASGKLVASKVVKDVTLTTPLRASKYKKAYESETENTLTDEAALSVLVELNLSRDQYQGLRHVSRQNNCKLFPSYKRVLAAKKTCYPPRDTVIITETKAEVQVQSLLDHTAQRILKVKQEQIGCLDGSCLNVELISKWGCDGSSGHAEYKQTFMGEDISDASLFFTSVVPLRMICTNEKQETVVIWKNPRSSSPRFCRPLRLQYIREDAESTRNEVKYIEDQVTLLKPFHVELEEKSIDITYNMMLTMIDGKVCSAITETSSSQRCYLCGATSKEFNDIDKILKKNVKTENIRFGLSTLHAWIRFFETCLHLSYKLVIKKWQARSKEEKDSVEQRKKVIQQQFSDRMGLKVDRPKQNFGSSNDGNTARRFFQDSKTASEITGVDENLIRRLHVILQTMSSGHEIDFTKFNEYTIKTAKMFVRLYPWYYMPTTLHKILIHGPQVISDALLPIGDLSEEAQESRNKDIKRYREDFTRKHSREKTMEDLLNRLFVTSDPYISCIRKLPKKKSSTLDPEALELLAQSSKEEELDLEHEMSKTQPDSTESESDDKESD